MKGLFILLLIPFLFKQSYQNHDKRKKSYKQFAFVNGNWFNGVDFALDTFYTVNGILTRQKPLTIDSFIDLQNKYVVPPFAEAHTHNISIPPIATELKPYIRNGVFYVMKQSNTYPVPKEGIMNPVIDIIEPAPILTPSGSHVTLINERSAVNGNFPGVTKDQLDGKTHVLIDSQEDIERKLGNLLDSKPVFIKLLLAFSEEYEKRRSDSQFIGKRGLNPAFIPIIVRKAHQRGIKVSTHIETAADFRIALNSDVDIIAHLPGLRIGAAAGFADTTIDRWLLTEADAVLAAKKRTAIVTTAIAGKTLLNPKKNTYAATKEIYIKNIKLLLSKKANLLLGSDYYEGTSQLEALLLGKQNLLGGDIEPLGLFNNLQLLTLWCGTTPRFIFPKRKIGELKEGYEANFLVLDGNPLQDFKYVTKIWLRVKRGELINL